MARGAVTVNQWFEEASRGAPAALRERASAFLANATDQDLAEALLSGSLAALGQAVRHPGDRSVALDLLAADALVTLALAAVAEQQPGRVAAFAARVRMAAVLVQ